MLNRTLYDTQYNITMKLSQQKGFIKKTICEKHDLAPRDAFKQFLSQSHLL